MTSDMTMGDRPSRRGRSAAADPVIDAVQKEDMESLHIRIPAELRKAAEDALRRGRRVNPGVGDPGDRRQTGVIRCSGIHGCQAVAPFKLAASVMGVHPSTAERPWPH